MLGAKVAVCSKPAVYQVPVLRGLIHKASRDVIYFTSSDDLKEDPFILPDILGYLRMHHPSRWAVPTDLYRLAEGCEGAGGRRADQPPGVCGGVYGCGRCLQTGKTVKTSKRGHVHTFPYQALIRTLEQVVRNLREAVESGSVVNGVKGPSWLSYITYFNIVRGSLVDYMHTVLLGVCRGLLFLWLDNRHRQEAWYLGTNHRSLMENCRVNGQKAASQALAKPGVPSYPCAILLSTETLASARDD